MIIFLAGFMGAVFQSFVNSASNLVFDAMKPFMLKEAYEKITTEVDSHLDKAIGDNVLPNSIAPLDMAIAEGRKKIRALGYDPFKVRDYNHTVGMFSMEMTKTWIVGVSSFYRVGNITVSMINNTVTVSKYFAVTKAIRIVMLMFTHFSYRNAGWDTTDQGIYTMGAFCG